MNKTGTHTGRLAVYELAPGVDEDILRLHPRSSYKDPIGRI
jgi:hypothetical protein